MVLAGRLFSEFAMRRIQRPAAGNCRIDEYLSQTKESAIELGRHGFRQRRDEGDTH
jgi:hypothetical protein